MHIKTGLQDQEEEEISDQKPEQEQLQEYEQEQEQFENHECEVGLASTKI